MNILNRADIERTEDWIGWIEKIPYLPFKKDWEVKFLPPFAGAIARFWLKKGEKKVSVYLDCFDRLANYGSPYWEVYPYQDDVGRFDINDTEGLMAAITEELEKDDQ